MVKTWLSIIVFFFNITTVIGRSGLTGCFWGCVKAYVPIGEGSMKFLFQIMAEDKVCVKLATVKECVEKCDPDKVQTYALWVFNQWQEQYCFDGGQGANEFYEKTVRCVKAVKDAAANSEQCDSYPPQIADELCDFANDCVNETIKNFKEDECSEPGYQSTQYILSIAYGFAKDNVFGDEQDAEQCAHYLEIPGSVEQL